MVLQQLFILAIAAMFGLAALRVVRVHTGRASLPQENARVLFVVAFLLVVPVVLGALLIQPATNHGQLPALAWVPLYLVMVAGLWIVMRVAARGVEFLPRGRWRRFFLIALVGSEGKPTARSLNPPVTAKLAEGVALVDRTNAAFPRGPAFPIQISRTGFHSDWDALDAATRTLEGQIADDHRLGLSVAEAALATAFDARSRLDTLRILAVDDGQTWAIA